MFQISPEQPSKKQPRAFIVLASNGLVWLGDEGSFNLKAAQDVVAFTSKSTDYAIGTMEDSAVILKIVPAEEPSQQWHGLRSVLLKSDEKWYTLLSVARQVMEWEKQHQFCGICGSKTTVITEKSDRYKYCSTCRHRWYPRISPCVICVIVKEDKLLLAKPLRVSGDWYSALAGFVEPGESVEQALHREVMEEVGIEVTNLQYIGSQAWSFPQQLMIGFLCEYKSGDIAIAEDEIADAGWFTFDQLPNTPPTKSLSGQLIQKAVEKIALSVGVR